MEDEDLNLTDPTAAGEVLSQLSKRYGALGQQETAARQQYERTRAQRLQEAEERIRSARFGAPSSAEQMFALSAALLSPKPFTGLAGTLSNVVPMLGRLAGAKRGAEADRETALLKLRQQYESDTDAAGLEALGMDRKNILDLMKVYGPLAKPKSRRTQINPVDGRVYDLDTAEEVVPVSQRLAQIPPEAINNLRTKLADPNLASGAKAQERVAFEQYYGVPVNRVLGGQ